MSLWGYIASLEFWRTVGTGLGGAAVAALILAWFGKTWIGARIKRDVEDIYDAKQQQRQADFDRGLEERKSELSKELEGWKAGYQRALDENQIRFSRFHAEQADAIKSLYARLVRMERKLRELVNPLQFVPEDQEARKEFHANQRREFIEAFIAFRDFFEESRIYLSPEVCGQLDTVLDTAHSVYVDFTVYDEDKDDLDGEGRKQRTRLRIDAHKTMTDQFPSLRQELEDEFRTAMGMVESTECAS